MYKQFKYFCLLATICLCVGAISPLSVLANNEPYATQIDDSSDSTQINIINDAVLEIVYGDGRKDIVEKRPDGVYLNGQFFSEYERNFISKSVTFRAINPKAWHYVSTVRGNVLENSFRDNLMNLGLSAFFAKLGAIIGGPWTWIIGAAFSGIGVYQSWLQSNSPYPYYITTTYINAYQRKWKFITQFYKNSNYSGYVKTETTYVNF